jgi:carbamoyltransferase
MKILGLSCFYHDSAAALIIDGQPMAAAQEERFSRKKNDPSLPVQSIRFCLKKFGLKLSDLDAVVFYEKPLMKLDRILETFLRESPFQPRAFVESFARATQKTLFLRPELTKELKALDPLFLEDRLLFSEHHLSHAASAFFPSPFDSAVVLTMDGIGEWATTTVSIGEGNSLTTTKEIHFPHSLGLYYSAITSFCGFKVNSGEYKLMGLAPFGTPRFRELIFENLIQLHEDGSFRLGLDYFDFSSSKNMFTPKMSSLFGVSPRKPESALEQIYMDIAASAQEVLNEAILNLTKSISKEYPQKNLCLAGGVALNCVSNSKIKDQNLFDNIWIQPASGDAGGALGAALAAHSLHFKKQRYRNDGSDAMSFAYMGTEYGPSDILAVLQKFELSFEQLDESKLLIKTTQSLCRGQSVAWFQGKMEYGPRALGARSILADARNPAMQRNLNLQIKFRESFRPFAPIVLEEKANEWFEGKTTSSPYMLFVDKVLQKHLIPQKATFIDSFERLNLPRSTVPAITHLDYSARLQTVCREQNPRLYQLISLFEKETGVPMLVNTSFNVRGEPIVESPQDAILCFLKTGIDVLVIGDYFVEKNKNQSKIIKDFTLKDLD